MYLFSEKGMRCRVSYISKRHSKASNKCLESYDPNEESKDYTYLDANNLHSYTVSKFLATGRLKWIDPKEFDLNEYMSNSLKDFVLQVDHKELRDLHNDYPLATY